MLKVCKILALISLAIGVSSCTSFWSSDDDHASKAKETVASEKGVSGSSNESADKPSSKEIAPAPEQAKVVSEVQAAQIAEQISLAQARTVERMAEIEAELRQQRETIKLLEQGLLTGIAPDDLKKNSEKKSEVKAKQASNGASELDENIEVALGVETPSPLGQPVLDSELLAKANSSGERPDASLISTGQFESFFAIAKAKYQSSDFSGALADFADLSRKHGENVQGGILRLWLGKSYVGLKEFPTARQEFEAYLAIAPKSSQVAEARIDLARVLLRLGLKERAQNELKRVISDFDGQESAEVAAHELGTLQGAL